MQLDSPAIPHISIPPEKKILIMFIYIIIIHKSGSKKVDMILIQVEMREKRRKEPMIIHVTSISVSLIITQGKALECLITSFSLFLSHPSSISFRYALLIKLNLTIRQIKVEYIEILPPHRLLIPVSYQLAYFHAAK